MTAPLKVLMIAEQARHSDTPADGHSEALSESVSAGVSSLCDVGAEVTLSKMIAGGASAEVETVLEMAGPPSIPAGPQRSLHLPWPSFDAIVMIGEQYVPKSTPETVESLLANDNFTVFCRHWRNQKPNCDMLEAKCNLPAHDHNSAPPLTRRELQCLSLCADGKTHWESGKILNISERTVVFHMKVVRDKLNADTNAHAVAKAVRICLI